MPFINKFGRRPCYILAFVVYTGCGAWAGVATSYSSELAARIMIGLFGGAGECLAPLTIADIWFLHERGSHMAYV
jgi:MFS family permease